MYDVVRHLRGGQCTRAVGVLWLCATQMGCEGLVGALPVDEGPPVEPAKFFAGQALYDRNCAACHGVLEASAKRGRSTEDIEHALASVGMMRAFEPGLDDESRELIRYALSVPPEAVECPPLDSEDSPRPLARSELAFALSEATELSLSDVRDHLSGYATGYDDSSDFDNQDVPVVFRDNSIPGLVAALERIAQATQAARADCQGDRGCATTTLDELASQASGVDLEDALANAIASYDEAIGIGLNPEESLELAIVRLFLSPRFLFKGFYAGDVGVAERLTFFLAARRPSVTEATQSTAELADTLLETEGIDSIAQRFGLGWTQLARLSSTMQTDSSDTWPFDAALFEDFLAEVELSFAHAVRTNQPIGELLTQDQAWLNADLAAYYGLGTSTGGATHEPTSLAKVGRGGLLASAAVSMVTSHGEDTSVTLRGKWVVDNILCLTLPPPPVDAAMQEMMMEPPSEDPSPRERSEHRRSNAACQGCHFVMDEIGFGLEAFDTFGKTREAYPSDHPVLTAGKLPGGLTFADAKELAAHLASSPAYRMCMAKKATTFAMARPLTEPESCRVRRLAFALPAEVGLRDLLQAIIASDVFHQANREGLHD